MTHISEAEFADEYALPWLETHYPNASIERQHWVGGTGAFADAWVRIGDGMHPAVILAVEIGNDRGVRNDCAQAIEYAGNHDRAVPYVIIPAYHAEHSVVDVFRNRGVVIVELPTADG